MSNQQSNQADALHRMRQIKEETHALLRHLRSEEAQVDDPEARSMLETAAEVLGGLVRAFDGYDQKNASGQMPANSAEAATEARQSARQASEWTDHLEGIPPGKPE